MASIGTTRKDLDDITSSSESPQVARAAKLYEGWWMLSISPLVFATHAFACYLSADAYCNVAVGGDTSGVIPGIVLAYTLVSLVSIVGVAHWSYRRSHASTESGVVQPAREERLRALGRGSLLLSGLSAVAVLIVTFVAPFAAGICQ